MGTDQYDVGSGISVPGLEAVLEYGDASRITRDAIPGAMRINDRLVLERARLTQIDGIQADPDGRDSRQVNSDSHGEAAGIMLYGGRTIGLTGEVEAGSIPAMRDVWRRLQGTFGTLERDLLIHVPQEVKQLRNELGNPSFDVGSDDWALASSSGLPSLTGGVVQSDGTKVGLLEVTLDAAGQVILTGLDPTFQPIEWSGEDIWVTAHMRIESAADNVSSLSLGVAEQESPTDSRDIFQAVNQTFPATGVWYALSLRVAGDDIQPGTRYIAISLYATCDGTGAYSIQIDRAALVLLDSSDATPLGYFDGDTTNFEWVGNAHESRSIGPCYSTNIASNARLEDDTLAWSAENSTGVTVASGPILAMSWKGDEVPRSAYYRATKDNNTTSRNMGLKTDGPISSRYPVISGRQYRWTLRVNVISVPVTGALRTRITWYDCDGNQLSTTNGDAIPAGESDVEITATAPDGASSAMFMVQAVGVTTAVAVLELYVSDNCIVDVSDYAPDSFFGTGSPDDEVATESSGAGLPSSRRRIPRPFLIKRVRKTSDGRAPEQQQGFRAVRAFTMSLRAADPRIYALDERRAYMTMAGDPQLVVRQMPDDFSISSGTLTEPTGWTYEGHFVTHPGTGNPYNWSRSAWNNIQGGGSPATLPNGGVGIKAWGSDGLYGSNRPAQDLVARAYRSSESYVYSTPRVIMGCAPQGYGQVATGGPDLGSMLWTFGGTTLYWDTATILLKRVSSTTWLELRWNSLSNDRALVAYPAATNHPYAFELWCSHDSSGTLTTTRLAQWDYSFDSSSGFYPFKPSIDQMYLVAYMLDQTVYWELWSGYPSTTDLTSMIESGSYEMSAGLQSILGTAVDGSVGMALQIPRTDSQANFNTLAFETPFIHYFESSDASVADQTMSCPVIGSIDTPQVITLTGGLVDPIVSISAPEHSDGPARTSVARFSGTLDDSNTVVVDVATGLVLDQFGSSRRDLVVPGSDFVPFAPGINKITVRAKEWDAASPHVIASWMDALRSG